jgi:hypothetical protein
VVTALILLLIQPVGLAPWLAALVVGVVLAVIGAVMLRGGLRDLRQMDPAPRRTVESIKGDIELVKEQRP